MHRVPCEKPKDLTPKQAPFILPILPPTPQASRSSHPAQSHVYLLNKTPTDWWSKLQNAVETATFGSECIAARTCTEQIMDLRNTLRYLGVPIEGASMMFGDNETVVNTASVPHSKI